MEAHQINPSADANCLFETGRLICSGVTEMRSKQSFLWNLRAINNNVESRPGRIPSDRLQSFGSAPSGRRRFGPTPVDDFCLRRRVERAMNCDFQVLSSSIPVMESTLWRRNDENDTASWLFGADQNDNESGHSIKRLFNCAARCVRIRRRHSAR